MKRLHIERLDVLHNVLCMTRLDCTLNPTAVHLSVWTVVSTIEYK
jgi:hypothetical protein